MYVTGDRDDEQRAISISRSRMGQCPLTYGFGEELKGIEVEPMPVDLRVWGRTQGSREATENIVVVAGSNLS